MDTVTGEPSSAGQPAGKRAELQVLIPGPRAAQDVFGAWQGCQEGGMSDAFGVVWRADLPEDLPEAGQVLRTQAYQLLTAAQALPAAEQRLAADLAMLPAVSGGAAFGSLAGTGGDAHSDPRAVLFAAQRYCQPAAGAAFAGGEEQQLSPFDLEQIGERFEQFIDQVKRSLGQLALVETNSGGRQVASSRVDWLGNVDTWWAAGPDSERSVLHARVLNQALQTRQHWLRFALLITGGAVQVGASLSAGPLGLLSIWTTWNYVQRVIDEFRRLNAAPPPV